jgi:RNA-binding protein NOB1
MMEHIILDAGALISGETKQLHKFGSKLWTVPEVLAEIRDSKARSQLAALPFEVEVRTPSEKALHTVSNFAQKTGDFAALSLCDLKVIALTYDLEIEMNGTVFMREAPKVRRAYFDFLLSHCAI